MVNRGQEKNRTFLMDIAREICTDSFYIVIHALTSITCRNSCDTGYVAQTPRLKKGDQHEGFVKHLLKRRLMFMICTSGAGMYETDVRVLRNVHL